MNTLDTEIRRRRSTRLKNYDYSQPGAYFVTICSQNRECLFGEIKNSEMVLNHAGQMITDVWHQIPAYYPGNNIGEFVVMPNHVHGIILVGVGPCAYTENGGRQRIVGADPRVRPQTPYGQHEEGQSQGIAPTLSLPEIVHRFKTMTTKRYADGVKQLGWMSFQGKLWQRNYYEHVIRQDDELNQICRYILDNPLKWASDRDNPECNI